jgi:hypothetical protein
LFNAIRYLNVTSGGRQWIANLHGNVFRAEREVNLSGPQRQAKRIKLPAVVPMSEMRTKFADRRLWRMRRTTALRQ